MKKGTKTHTTATETTTHSSSTPFFQKKGEQASVAKSTDFFQVPVQTKLSVNAPNDKYEKEADHVADTVTSGRPVGNAGLYSQISPVVQRKADKEEMPIQTKKGNKEEEKIQRKEEEEEMVQKKEDKEEEPIQAKKDKEEIVQKKTNEEEESVQRRSEGKINRSPNKSFIAKLKSRIGFGEPLPDTVRGKMEKGFGADFSAIRIHRDNAATSLTKAIKAQAFTRGKDVFFNNGKYDPASNKGVNLLAHELTHTIQQGAIAAKSNEPTTESNVETIDAPSTEGVETTASNDATPPLEEILEQTPTKEPLTKEEGAFSFTVDETETEILEDPTTKAPNSPEEDLAFQNQLKFVEKKGGNQRQHQPQSVEIANTKKAAKAPANEVETYSQGKHVAKLEEEGAKVKPFNKETFKKDLKERIKAIAPDSLGEMDKFKKSGGVDRVKDSVKGDVKKERDNTAGPLEKKNQEAPDQTGVEAKEFAEMPARPTPPTRGALNKSAATPKPKSTSEFEAPAEQQVAAFDEGDLKNEVDDQQLQEGNEPTFNTYLDEKQKAKTTITENVQTYRSEEETTLTTQQKETAEQGRKGLSGFSDARKNKLAAISEQQGTTVDKDEAARLKVATDLESIFTSTKTKVEKGLSDMETAVSTYFDAEAKIAQDKFTDFVDSELDAYKDARYSGIRGKARKLRDWWKGLPSAANKFYVLGKNQYIADMDIVIDHVATLVVNGLNTAQEDIGLGRKEVQTYLTTLDGDLKKYGGEIAEGIESKFAELESSIQNKQQQMIGDLAKKYADNLQQVNDKIEKYKEANKGMAAKIKDFALGIWKTIKELGKLLWSVVQRIGNVVGKIIKAPIRFFGNLVRGVKQGFTQFKKNLETHLQKALFKWLFGTMSKAGIQLPEKFDLKGIFALILQVLGLGMAAIRERAVKILGKPIVEKLEKGGKLFKMLLVDGPSALIKHAKNKIVAMKNQVVNDIKKMVSKEIIFAGITFVLGMLTPVGAFIKACKGIYTLIKFFIEKAKDIIALVNAVLNSVEAMIAGKVQVAADKVETALAKFLPLGIGFLASLIGISGLAKKVRKIVERIQLKVREKIIDPIIKKAFSLAQKAGKLFSNSKLGKMGKKGTAFVKGKAKQAKAKVKEVKDKAKAKVKGIKDKLVAWWKVRKKFKDKNGEDHELYYNGKGKLAKLYVASDDPSLIEGFFKKKKREEGESSDLKEAVKYYKEKVKPSQNKLVKADQGGKKTKGAKSINANKKQVANLESNLKTLGDKLKGLIVANEGEYPPTKLPVMADNKKAGNFTANYITFGLKPGSESGKHVGNLDGWSKLQGHSLTDGAKWVRMHLLPHKLGGNAVDSNLTPALGIETNLKFSSEVEQPAIKVSTEASNKDKDKAEAEVIWYKFKISYHGGEFKAFPSSLHAQWGNYENSSGEWKKGDVKGDYKQTPEPPEFTTIIPNLNDTPLDKRAVKAQSGVDSGFIELILKARKDNSGSFGSKPEDVQDVINARYKEFDLNTGEIKYKFGINPESYDSNLLKLISALDKKDIIL